MYLGIMINPSFLGRSSILEHLSSRRQQARLRQLQPTGVVAGAPSPMAESAEPRTPLLAEKNVVATTPLAAALEAKVPTPGFRNCR